MKNLYLFLVSVILGMLIIPIGFPYTILKYIFSIIKQIYKIIIFLLKKSEYPFFLKLAIAIDLFGNVTSGEMIEDILTAQENTLYGNGDYTISAATGELEIKEELNKKGIWFTKKLSVIFGKNHSIKAYLSTVNK